MLRITLQWREGEYHLQRMVQIPGQGQKTQKCCHRATSNTRNTAGKIASAAKKKSF